MDDLKEHQVKWKDFPGLGYKINGVSLKFIGNEKPELRRIGNTEQKSVVELFWPCTNEFQSKE